MSETPRAKGPVLRGRAELDREKPDEIIDTGDSVERRARRVAARADYLSRAEHMLRTHLTLVEGWADALEESAGSMDRATLERAAAAIGRNARTLGRLLHGMMREAALAARLETLESVPIDIAALAARLAEEDAGLRTGANIEVSPTFGVFALGAEDELEVLLRHLLENARKFSGERGPISITIGRAGRRGVELVVSDRGPGLPKGVRLIEPFVRAGSGAGHGLGLHVVRSLVEAMGGSIRAENRVDRPGARFIVTLRSVRARAR
jgi:signal transduction histidine kinase